MRKLILCMCLIGAPSAFLTQMARAQEPAAAPAGEVHAAPAGETHAAPAGETHAAPAGETHAAPAHEGVAAEGHGAAGHAAEGHGGGHHEEGPVIANWWDWSKRNPPPFGFALLNFLIFAAILYKGVGNSFREFLKTRHLEVARDLDEAAAVRKQAEEQLQRYEAKLQGLNGEVAALLAGVQKEAEAERARIIAAAEEQAAQLKKDAEAQIQQEISRARADLQRTVVQAAMQAAEALLKKSTQEADQKRLVEDYVTRIEALAPAVKRSAR